jgi:hypothetical protein
VDRGKIFGSPVYVRPCVSLFLRLKLEMAEDGIVSSIVLSNEIANTDDEIGNDIKKICENINILRGTMEMQMHVTDIRIHDIKKNIASLNEKQQLLTTQLQSYIVTMTDRYNTIVDDLYKPNGLAFETLQKRFNELKYE